MCCICNRKNVKKYYNLNIYPRNLKGEIIKEIRYKLKLLYYKKLMKGGKIKEKNNRKNNKNFNNN